MSKAVFWTPVIIWAGVIFLFSTLVVVKSPEFNLLDFIIKKSAHFVEYGILALLFYRALVNTADFSKKKAGILALLFVVFYGISDEYHQSFTPGREPTVRDVAIDSFGGVTAIVLLWKYLPKMPRRLRKLAKSLQIA